MKCGENMKTCDVAIVGGGISGLVFANELCNNTSCSVVLLEKGEAYSDRLKSSNPNLLEGLGGAGTLGGGKLCYPPASGSIWDKTHLDDICLLTNTLNRYFHISNQNKGYSKENTYLLKEGYYEKIYYSELITKKEMNDCILQIIDELYSQKTIEIKTQSTVTGYVDYKGNKLILYRGQNGVGQSIVARHLVFACGRSSAADLPTIMPYFEFSQQPVDLGIRLVLPLQGSGAFGMIGNDVKFKANYGNVSVRSFCTCSGGKLAKIRYKGLTYYDGHYDEQISSEANFGILARSNDCVGTKAAINFLKQYQYMVDKDISLEWFLNNWDTIVKSEEHEELFYAIAKFSRSLLNDGAITEKADKIKVAMPSADRLNPRIMTDEHFRTIDPNVWVIGDASGISRGFIQSLWSGYIAARSLANEMNNELSRRCNTIAL